MILDIDRVFSVDEMAAIRATETGRPDELVAMQAAEPGKVAEAN